ncbi:hypothetical protein GIB67_010998, partial [Kingdonia uniflora]
MEFFSFIMPCLKYLSYPSCPKLKGGSRQYLLLSSGGGNTRLSRIDSTFPNKSSQGFNTILKFKMSLRYRHMRQPQQQIITRTLNLEMLDPTDQVCTPKLCDVIDDNEIGVQVDDNEIGVQVEEDVFWA